MEIYELNKNIIKNPALIYPGQVANYRDNKGGYVESLNYFTPCRAEHEKFVVSDRFVDQEGNQWPGSCGQ